MRLASLLFALALGACTKSDPPSAPAADAGGKAALLGRGLADPQDPGVQQAKGALVLQQCNLACGARPGIEPGACTQQCRQECASQADIAAIDACASRVAAASPTL